MKRVKPGELNCTIDFKSGTITNIKPNSSLNRLGVKEGWIIKKIDNGVFTKKKMNQKINGNITYRLTFEIPKIDATKANLIDEVTFLLVFIFFSSFFELKF